MTDEKSETKPAATDEEVAEANAAEAEEKAERDRAEKREARKVRVHALKTQVETWEDRLIVVYHTLEQRKLDLLVMDEGPRQLFLRDEAKKYLSEYTELRKMCLRAVREMDVLLADELAEMDAENRPANPWAPLLGGFLGGLGAYALANMMRSTRDLSKAVKEVADQVKPMETVAPPTEPSGGVDAPAGGDPQTASSPLGDKQNA